MRLKDAISRSVTYLQHITMGGPEYVIYFGYGLGDDLLCTTLAHELKKRGARSIVMFSKFARLYEGNPDILATKDWGYPSIGRRHRWGYGSIIPQYAGYDPANDRDLNPPCHFLQTMCSLAGMQGEIDLRPYLYLGAEEKNKGRLFSRQAVIHTGGRNDAKNKEWSSERYQAVIDYFGGEIHWIQLGTAGDPLMRGAYDLRGKTTLRESAAMVANSHVLLGQAGFLMHVARAVGTRAVIVYGGREDPAISGYRCFENIVGRTPCSYCWQRNRCDFGHECMQMITVDQVAAAVRRQLDLIGTPLEVERAVLRPVTIPLHA
jgi:ADP-heptose:LPS heptosyltransferase